MPTTSKLFRIFLGIKETFVGVLKEWEKVAFRNRYKALSSVKVGFQILRILPREWRKHYHIKEL
jgi:hypothetical protein